MEVQYLASSNFYMIVVQMSVLADNKYNGMVVHMSLVNFLCRL